MNLTNAWTVALAALTFAGVITWTWLAVARVMTELRSINNFEGMHLED